MHGGLCLVGGTHAGAVEECEESSQEEETMCVTDHNPIRHTAGGDEAENSGVKLNLEEGRGEGKVFLTFGFISHYAGLI